MTLMQHEQQNFFYLIIIFCVFLFSSSFLSLSFSLRREGYTVQVSVNDYLDIYCPHYNQSQRGALERGVAEQYILYMVSYRGYRTCDPQMGFKRWECNRPHAPHAPIKFSEKFQRYSAFSLGYEFNVGHEYYYICEYLSLSNMIFYSLLFCLFSFQVSSTELQSHKPQKVN